MPLAAVLLLGLQYRNVRPDYVQKLWSLVNWADVTRRFDTARAGGTGLTAPSK